MAITNASRLADFGSGIGTAGAVLQIDNSSNEVGIGTTNPNATLTVGNIGASGTSIYVHGDGRIIGVLTATKFSGGWDGALSISDDTASTSSSTGALIVSGGVGIAKSLFVGEGVSIAGTITYDDVTNIDSVGIVTAGKGFRATTGGIIVTAGISTLAGTTATNISVSGITTLTGGTIVAGITTIDASGFNITGVVTATSFSGPTNVPAGQTGTVTLAASDAGKHVAATGTVTLGTGIFAVGDAVTIWNNSAGAITITLSAVTCYNAADASTGNRTLGARGLATILCVAANTYVISGAGLS